MVTFYKVRVHVITSLYDNESTLTLIGTLSNDNVDVPDVTNGNRKSYVSLLTHYKDRYQVN